MRTWLAGVLIGLMPGLAAAQAPPVSAGGGASVPASITAPPPTGVVVPPSTSALLNVPNDFPHPTQTWNFLSPNVYPRPQSIRGLGQVIRYFEVPAQSLVVPTVLAGAESAPAEWTERVLTVPGYYIAETTTGYIYPARWVLEALNVGVYGWRLLPAEFLRK